MGDSFKHGTFSWCELMTTDVPAAKAFYGKLFGWETEDMAMPEMTYTVVKVGGTGIGGIMQMPPGTQGASPAWGAYVTVDDVDASAKLAEQLGATICVPPRDIPNVGRFCVIQDPQGAFLNLITYTRM